MGTRTRSLFTGLASMAAVAGMLLGPPSLAQTAKPGQLPSPALKQQQEAAAELWRRNETAAALAASERLLAATRAEFGPDHEQVAIQAYGLGFIADAAGRWDIAERAFRENVRIGEKVYGKDSAGVTQGMEKLGEALVALGRPAEAEPILKRVLSIRSGIVGADHSYNASAHAGLGAVSLARGDAQGALASYREAVRLLTGKREAQTLAAHVMENEVRRQASAFTGLVDAAWQVANRGGDVAALAGESYAASQRAWTTTAASALARMSARLAACDSDLGRRIRRRQD
ncbi:MAG: tetratricopeptide repeat protein, partial [Hyphomicrobiaceae bacterium]